MVTGPVGNTGPQRRSKPLRDAPLTSRVDQNVAVQGPEATAALLSHVGWASAARHHARTMEALRSDLGVVPAGTRVSVHISDAANVRLVDVASAVLQQNGVGHVYYGGLYAAGRVALTVPETDQWFLLVDVEGLDSRPIVSDVRVERPSRLGRLGRRRS